MKIPVLLFSGALAAATALPIRADSSSLEGRVEALEARLTELARENGELKQALGRLPKTGAVVNAAGKEASLSLGGYLQTQAEFGDAPDTRFAAGDRFLVRRARFGLKGSFAEQFDFTVMSEFGANTIGSSTGIRGQATDAFVVWKRHEAANVTVGQFKTPYGYEQLLPDTKVITIERSLPNDRLTLSRQIGAMVSGTVHDRKFGYAVGLFNGSGVNTSVNDNDQFMSVARATGTVLKTDAARVALGVGAFTSRDTGTFTGRRTGSAFDAQAVVGPLEVNAEYFRTRSDRDTGADSTADGWSLLGAWFVVPKKLQAIGRYEAFDPNRSVRGDDADLWTVGLNYLIKGDDLKLAVNYLLGDPAGAADHQGRLITRLQIVF